MAEKQTNKDRMREIVDSIENGIKELFESDKYRQYLSTMSRFHRYSVNNRPIIRYTCLFWYGCPTIIGRIIRIFLKMQR